MEEPHHFRGSQLTESVTDLSNQPLNFAPHFNRDPEVHAQPNYTHASGGPVRGGDPPSNYSWTPSSAYPPVPPTMPSGPQVLNLKSAYSCKSVLTMFINVICRLAG